MFFLSFGILEKISKRGFIVGQSMTYDNKNNDTSKILLRNYDNPAIVMIEEINFVNDNTILLLKLFDGKDHLNVRLEKNLWKSLSEVDCKRLFGNVFYEESIRDEKLIKIGAIIILSEYTFRDTIISSNNKVEDMITILNFSTIGIEEKIEKSSIIPEKLIAIANIDQKLNNADWVLNATVVKDFTIKEFKNKNNGQEGQLKKLHLKDESGVIELIAFNKEIEKINNLKIDNIYSIYNAEIKTCNQNYKNELNMAKFELIVNKNTMIIEQQQSSIEMTKRHDIKIPDELSNYRDQEFLNLQEIMAKKIGESVSILAVVKFVEDLQKVSPKNKQPISLKNVFITDKSEIIVKVSFWGLDAENFNYKKGNLLMLKNLKVGNYQGIQLSAQRETIITKVDDFNNSKAEELKHWWDQQNEEEISSSFKRSATFNELNSKKFKE